MDLLVNNRDTAPLKVTLQNIDRDQILSEGWGGGVLMSPALHIENMLGLFSPQFIILETGESYPRHFTELQLGVGVGGGGVRAGFYFQIRICNIFRFPDPKIHKLGSNPDISQK
jgi:hypothetical protein